MQANPLFTGLVALAVPGAGHFLVGQQRKAVIFFVVLFAMFVIGLQFSGELFPFQPADPLVFLAALAQWATMVFRFGAELAGAGRGDVVAVTYEYGNTFLIVAGLLNILLVLDAVDIARGAKPR
jgi:hypothetical protein